MSSVRTIKQLWIRKFTDLEGIAVSTMVDGSHITLTIKTPGNPLEGKELQEFLIHLSIEEAREIGDWLREAADYSSEVNEEA